MNVLIRSNTLKYWSPVVTYLLQHHQPIKSLCSSSSQQLFIPRYNLSFRSCAFRFSAPLIWNSLSAFASLSHFLLLNAISRLTFSVTLSHPPTSETTRDSGLLLTSDISEGDQVSPFSVSRIADIALFIQTVSKL